ncbi:hypothetical protein EJB05_56927, partial [Eragrostis curvula]
MIKGSTGHRSHPIGVVPFEAFHNGSWHGVNSIRIRNGGLFVKFVYSGSTIEHNIDGDYLRIHPRRATCFDCTHFLKPGFDVCVQQATSRGESETSALLCRDARLIHIKRNHQTDVCHCLFLVIFYKDQCPGSKEKVIMDRITEVVTIDSIFILQKLQSEELQDGSLQWNSAEDCLHHNRCKLLSSSFSAEVAYLIVLSSLRGMEFNIKLIDGKIIYQIIKGDQAGYNIDYRNAPPPGFGKNMEIVSFQPRDETLRPRIRTVPIIRVETHDLSEIRCITVKNELDSAQDANNLYEHVDLRRSKRQKTQPDRFTSYDDPNFSRTYKCKRKEEHSSPAKNDDSQSSMSWDSLVQGESSDEDVLGNATVKQTVTRSLVLKEHPSPTEGQQKTPRKITQCYVPMKEKQNFVEVKKSTTEQKCPDSHIPHTPAKNKEKYNRPSLSFRLKSFTSPRSLDANSEPAFCQKRGRKRKKHMRDGEYKQMIEQCIGNIQCEMERDSEFKLDIKMMNWQNSNGHAYQEEDFTWPSSAHSEEEKDEHEELWKEMDYALATLAFLEQNQVPDSEAVNEGNADLGNKGEEQCHHDCILDEKLGLTCGLCGIVCIEAKHMFPPMFFGKDCERPARSNLGQDGDVLDYSFLQICEPEFSQFKGSGNVWDSINDLKPKLYPHQRKAFEFMWKNLAGSLQLEEMDNSTASRGGCVVAHTPGAGKTMLLISFLISYLKVHPRSRPLVLTPKAAIHTWRREFEKWDISLPLHVLHHSECRAKPTGTLNSKLQAVLKNFHQPSSKMMRIMDCLDKLCKWHEQPSILLMTYSSFLALTKEGSEVQHREFMATVLMNNPGLLILDEGHNPRSNRSKLRKLLMKVKTEFRILLSGTVFQNNFEEYFNTLSLARPRFVNDVMTTLAPEKGETDICIRTGKHQEALARRVFVEKVGQKIESSSRQDRIDGISLLNKLTCGFIDSFEGTKLNGPPGICVYTLFMKPTDIQEDILTKLTMRISGIARYPLEVELLITIASIHPWLIKTTKCASTYFSQKELARVERYKKDVTVGCKAKFVIDLLHKSSFRGEKVLIFCHNVSPINFLVKLIEVVFGWRLGDEVLVLQGDQELPVRSDVMDKFNGDRKGKRKVLIASTTACAEGISLTGASRVVMLDSEWNHSKTRQAIARAFRPGQERMVYVYLLVASGTWEEDKYNSNRRKAWTAKMVFFGRYFDDPSQDPVTAIDDGVLKELADEDKSNTFHKIVKQDWTEREC